MIKFDFNFPEINDCGGPSIERKQDPRFKNSNPKDSFWHFGRDTEGNRVKIYPSKVVLDIKL